MKLRYAILFNFVIFLFSAPLFSEVSVKVKDISFIDGLKENQVYGYGLVVGLQGTGDTRKTPITRSSLKNLLKNLGMEGEDANFPNTAAVLITAKLPAFVRVGDRIDVTVSSIGDAKSLEGGILVQSPLRGADNAIYAVAQGALSTARASGNRRQVRTVAQISGGALVEREVGTEIVFDNNIFVVLKEWDYTLANTIIKAVANKYPAAKPEMTKGGKIRIGVITGTSLPEFISAIENIEVTPKYRAKVVVNERDGTIVTGGEVKVSEAMVSKEGLTVEIKETANKASALHVKDAATVKDLVDSLNAIGATTSDIISILKALEASGALHAEFIVR
jgi:flagellar P-ring protein FlgI